MKTPHAGLLLLIAVLLPPFALDALGEVIDERTVATPYGPFGPLALRAIPHSPPVWVAPYTGSPTRSDPRAAIHTLRMLDIRRLLIWDSAIALNPVLPRGITAIVTDYIDWTRHLPTTFGFQDHHTGETTPPPSIIVPSRQPRPITFCPEMDSALQSAFSAPEVTYLGVDDLRRETAAEARMFRFWGADVIGRNLIPEVALARERGHCVAGLVTIDDFDTSRPAPIAKGEVRAAFEQGIYALATFARQASQPPHCPCDSTSRGSG